MTILAFPLIIIVPYMAFRSLAAERDDKTFELLAVTTLTPRQIIAGKMFSALTHIMLYTAAVLPCLAFSYLLQGIDFKTIVFLMFWIITVSIAYTVLALLFATIAKERFWQILLSLGIIIGVGLSFIAAYNIIESTVRNLHRFSMDTTFWPVMVMLAANAIGGSAFVFFTAASQITFASDNRSSAVRIAPFCCTQFLSARWPIPTGINFRGTG